MNIKTLLHELYSEDAGEVARALEEMCRTIILRRKIMTSDYETVKSKFKYLFELYDLPEPKVIRKALKTDPCDVTDPPNEVRINTQDCDEDYQARHLFGHYLADLHLIDDQSDVVADIIADMILESKRYLKWGWKREQVMREI